MGLIATDLSADAYYASGEFNHCGNPPAIHLVFPKDEEHKLVFSLYQGSGGEVASLLSSTPSGANTQVRIAPQNKLATAVHEICLAFGLTKDELAQVCQVQSRKTLYNWINGDTRPRKLTMNRVFDLLITARAWLGSGFAADREQLREPVLGNQSLFDLLNQLEIDKERILFAGSRLNLRSPEKEEISDPFA